MVKIGDYNILRVVKKLDFGLYLDGGDDGEILLPTKYVPEGVETGDDLNVFIYFDSEDRIIATTEQPTAKVGEFALLEVVAVTKFGAFLDWGLAKDLMVPFREQKIKMETGQKHVVYIYVDEQTQRIVASAKLDRFLDNVAPNYETDQEVELMIASKTELGYKVIINSLHWGMLYGNEVFQQLHRGDVMTGYIKKIREDDKIDVSLQKSGFARTETLQDQILDKLKSNKGFLPVSDKTDAQIIYDLFGCSKKSFKMTIGTLFKQRIIVIEKDGIRLV